MALHLTLKATIHPELFSRGVQRFGAQPCFRLRCPAVPPPRGPVSRCRVASAICGKASGCVCASPFLRSLSCSPTRVSALPPHRALVFGVGVEWLNRLVQIKSHPVLKELLGGYEKSKIGPLR